MGYIYGYMDYMVIKDYVMEAEKQLSCKETYEEVSSDPSFPH